MAFFGSRGLNLHYRELGEGTVFAFQHGLGASMAQTFDLFESVAGIRLIGFDARGHGLSELGPPGEIGLSTSADDLLSLLDFLEVKQAIVGGISMGAAIALNFARRYPQRTMGLVLIRPAWLAEPNAFNVRIFSLVAEFIETDGPEVGRLKFQQSPEYRQLMGEYPQTAESLLGQFTGPRVSDAVAILRRIARDSPIRSMAELADISVPTLVLANRQDPIHPFEYGPALAAGIRAAEFQEIPSKSADVTRHIEQTRHFLRQFMTHHFLKAATTL